MEDIELRILQNLDLETKIRKTKLRIKEWYEYFSGKVYISFSGGKDSTVLLDIVRSMYPDIPAVYIDTGLEYPEIREFVKTIDNVVWLRPKMPFPKVLEKYGYPVISKEQSQFIYEIRTTHSEKLKNIRLNGNKSGRGKVSSKWKYLIEAPFKISHKCCMIIKKNPSKLYEKQTGRHAFIGTMAEESSLRKTQYLQYGCNAFDKSRPISTPLGFWKEQDVWDYIHKYNISYSKIYDMGYKRTGCMFCAYGIHMDGPVTRFDRMKETHPAQYKYCMDKLNMREVLNYIGIKVDNVINITANKEIKPNIKTSRLVQMSFFDKNEAL